MSLHGAGGHAGNNSPLKEKHHQDRGAELATTPVASNSQGISYVNAPLSVATPSASLCRKLCGTGDEQACVVEEDAWCLIGRLKNTRGGGQLLAKSFRQRKQATPQVVRRGDWL